MRIGRSRRLVGRDRELAALREWLGAAPASGGVCLISGEPGVGKSRLAADALKLLPPGWLAVRGRATDRDRPVPFRAVAECLLAASRRRPLPDDPDTRAFSAVLGRLVPAWRHGEGAHEPVVVTAEAVLRVLRSLAAPGPAIVLVEDIQWADPETLAVLEYLADNARGEPVAVVATVRSDSPSPGLTLARDLAGRRAAEIIELNRLNADDVAGMAGDCLDTAEVSAEIRAFLDKAAGLPFLIEELVVTAAREGVLVKHGGGWALAETPADLVPDSYRESVSRRLAALGGPAAHVVQVAAVAGLSTDIGMLGLAAGLGGAEAGPAVHAACDSGLVTFENTTGRVEFRHALVRDAVLAGLLPGERAALAAEALAALSDDPAGLSDDALELAVDLAEQSGELARSARLLLTLARRAMTSGGLVTAEAALSRAQRRTAGDLALTATLGEALIELFVLKGDLGDLGRVQAETLANLTRLGADPARIAQVRLQVAQAAAAAGDTSWAATEASKAQELARLADDVHLRLSADVATAQAAMAQGDGPRAAGMARRVIEDGEADEATLLEAWMIVGRAERQYDLEASAAAFEAARELAVRSGSPLAELAALHEMATVAMLTNGDTGPLLAAAAQAERLGAVGLTAQLSLQLGGTYALTGQVKKAIPASERARELAHHLKHVLVEAMAQVQVATAHAIREDRPQMEAAANAALALAPEDPNVLTGIWGHARTLYSLLREDRVGAHAALDTAMAVSDRAGGIHGLFYTAWALVAFLDAPSGELAGVITDRLATGQAAALPVNRGLSGYALAAVAGFRGDPQEAARLVSGAEKVLSGQTAFDLWRQLGRRLAAEAALRDGWGEPVEWLRECLAAFNSGGHRHVASACRVLLSRAGATIPRRSGDVAAPPDLAALGVTAREAEVLRLVAEGLTNREIGERLFLSPRTVEKHIERLLAKTGAGNRSQLVARAAGGHLVIYVTPAP